MKVDDAHTKYEFISEGSKGNNLKAVIYGQIEEDLFNLAFGDWNAELNKVDDISRTNNGDRDKVLATVAATAIDFTNKYPDAIIYTEGSTPARTRLYQMGIANNLEEISEDLEGNKIVNLKRLFVMAHTFDNNKLRQAHITVVPGNKMPDYHNDSNVIAMVEKARSFLKKAGLPKGWGKKKGN